MDDRELAKIIRKRNLAYVKHLNEIQPHLEKHDHLVGGVWNAVAAAARIAARALLKAGRATARAAAKGAKAAARAAAKGAKAAARAAAKAAKATARTARNAGKNIVGNIDTIATVADIAERGYNISQILKGKQRRGEPITEEEWDDLDDNQKVEIDFQRWARGLNKEQHGLFMERGGTIQAAMEVVRLMQAGVDPDDWVGKAIDDRIESIMDVIDELDAVDPADDDECQDILDTDPRSKEFQIMLQVIGVFDFGISEAISDAKAEKMQQEYYEDCVKRKTKQNADLRAQQMAQLGLGPNDTIDMDDLTIRSFAANTLAAMKPVFKQALELDGFRAASGLPPILPDGSNLRDQDTIDNDNCEKIAIYFIENQTTEYEDQWWIMDLLKKDPSIVDRAIAKIPYYASFASTDPQVVAFKNEYTTTIIPLTPQEQGTNDYIDNLTDEDAFSPDKWYKPMDKVIWQGKYYDNVVEQRPGHKSPDGMEKDAQGNYKLTRTEFEPYGGPPKKKVKNPEKENFLKAWGNAALKFPLKESYDNMPDEIEVYDYEAEAAKGTKVNGLPISDKNPGYWQSNTGQSGWMKDKEVPTERKWVEMEYTQPKINKAGMKKANKLDFWIEDVAGPRIDEATDNTLRFDEKVKAQGVTDVFDPTKDYRIGDKVRYQFKVFECMIEQKAGEDKPDPAKWDELSLYDDEDYEALEKLGSATEWVDWKIYPIGSFVKYSPIPNSIWVRIKDGPPEKDEKDEDDEDDEEDEEDEEVEDLTQYKPGLKPDGPEKVWEQIIVNNADILDVKTNPGKKWNDTTEYKEGTVVLWDVDLKSYRALKDSKGIRPDDKNHWVQLKTFNLTDELAKTLKIEQRTAIFASAVAVAKAYDPDDKYPLHTIVVGFDGNYYELIKEKKNKAGEVVVPPIPPNQTYWKLVSDGVTVFDPSIKYKLHDFTLYENVYYICINADTPIGTLPTDKKYWELLNPIFDKLSPQAVEENKQNFYNAIISASEPYIDDPTSSYQVGDIVQVYDADGYPQFYECIKDIGAATVVSNDIKNKSAPYKDDIDFKNRSSVQIVYVGDPTTSDLTYYKINSGYNWEKDKDNSPTNSSKWDIIGYTKDPGPPNPEFWKDYSTVDIAEEKNEKIRDEAKPGSKDAVGLFVGDIIKDPITGELYKLKADPDQPEDYGTKEWFLEREKKMGRDMLPNETVDDAIKRLGIMGYRMTELPTFDNTKIQGGSAGDLVPGPVEWEPLDIPTEVEARILSIEARSRWKNTKLYKKDDIVIDKTGLKFKCVKDTPYAPMEPYWNQPEYFVPLDDDEWKDAIEEVSDSIKAEMEIISQNNSIAFSKAESNKPRTYGEIVFYNNKFYKFQALMQDENQNSPTVPKQKVPGELPPSGPIEWIPCDSTGNRLVIKDTEYPNVDFLSDGIIMLMYIRGGPIIQIKDKYYVYNASNKEIFGLGGKDDYFTEREWWTFQSWGSLKWKIGPEDTMTTEVYTDGKPVNQHDATGAIIGKNVDVSSLPKPQAEAIAEAVEETQNEVTCPTADNDGDDEDSHHERVQAERELEEAMIKWRAMGSIPEDNPMLLQGQKPEDEPIDGDGAGINIEELDGSQYHQKKKRVYKKKNKSKM